ncbi:MAG: hypothetical protein ACP6IQ_00970 [Candidatus Njordarchaeia archaeon]|nr:hypothetical protein [Candidatus Korarchaeota archaeon]
MEESRFNCSENYVRIQLELYKIINENISAFMRSKSIYESVFLPLSLIILILPFCFNLIIYYAVIFLSIGIILFFIGILLLLKTTFYIRNFINMAKKIDEYFHKCGYYIDNEFGYRYILDSAFRPSIKRSFMGAEQGSLYWILYLIILIILIILWIGTTLAYYPPVMGFLF